MDMKLGQWALSNSTPVRKQTVNKTQSRKLTPKTPWNSDEKAAIIKTLSKFLSLNGLHGKAEIEEVKRSEPALQKRPWQQIKFFINNHCQCLFYTVWSDPSLVLYVTYPRKVMLRDVELSAKHSWHCNQHINLVNNVAFEPLVNRGLQERTYLLLLLDIWCGINHTHIPGRV